MLRRKLHVFGSSYKGTKVLFLGRTLSRATNARPPRDPARPSKIIPVSVHSPRQPSSNMVRIRLPTDKRLSLHRALTQTWPDPLVQIDAQFNGPQDAS